MSADPPTPKGIPVFGNGLAFARDPVAAMEQWASVGDVVRLEIPGRSMYMVTDPTLIERVLVTDQQSYSIGPAQREFFSGVEDHAVTTNTGERWRRLRQALHPAFTRERIRRYAGTMGSTTAAFVDEWDAGETVDLRQEMRVLSVRILGDALLGVDLRGEEDIVMAAADALLDRANFRRPGQFLPDWVPTPTDRRFDRAVGRLDEFVEAVLEDRRSAEDEQSADVCSDLLAAESSGQLSMAEVRHNLVALLLAGHDSPATALTSALFLLEDQPNARQSVSEEYRRVVGGEYPHAEDVADLEFTRRVVAESLRLYPPTTGVNRQATEPVTLGGYELDAGAQLLLPQWVVHRDERFWDEPTEFDPDRWTRDEGRPDYAYFPFSGGPRACVGRDFARQELVVALASILGQTELAIAIDGPLTFAPSIQLRPEQAITATIEEGSATHR